MFSIAKRKNNKTTHLVRHLRHDDLLHHPPVEIQQFIFNAYSFLTLFSLIIFGLQHILAKQDPSLGYFEIAAGFAVAFNMLVFRIRRNAALARNCLLIIALAVLILMLLTGGLEETGIFWFFVFPVGAFFLTGKKAGLGWMTCLFAITLAVLFLSQAGLVYSPYSNLTLRQLLISLFVVTAGIYAYQYSREILADKTKQSEEESKEEKIKSETIIENTDEGIVAVDRSGVVVAINVPAEKMLGWKRNELIGKEFTQLIPMIDQQGQSISTEDRPMQQALQHPEVIRRTTTYLRKDGSLLPVSAAYRSIVMQGKIYGAVNTFQDITEEQQIDKAKSEFITLASHQLRTPISAIKWYTEMLLSGDTGKLSKEQSDQIQEIYNSNVRLGDIVDAMLTVSALELGTLAIQPESLRLSELCHRLIADLKHMLSNKKLIIKESYEPGVPALPLDPMITKTMIRNVLSNAIKYTPNGGTISVAIKLNRNYSLPAGKGSVDIIVKDTGFGIPANQHKNVFVKLFRAGNIKKKDTDGTGLGLYITKGLLEEVGGEISFSSAEGKGSTFVIRLPLSGMQPRIGAADASNGKGANHV